MATNLRQEYAVRSQTSNIFSGSDQTDTQRPGKRVGQAVKNESQVFSADAGDDSELLSARTLPAPPPFLTDNNAVDTHNRLGGFVQQSDTLVDIQELHDLNVNSGVVEATDNISEVKMKTYNENETAARTHKFRNNTSHIFDSPEAQQAATRRYDRNNMSNVF